MRCAWAITCSKGFIERCGQPEAFGCAGRLLIVLAFACVAVMSAFGKAAQGVSTGVLVFFQNFISLILFSPWVLRAGLCGTANSADRLHLMRAVGGLLSQALMFAAVKEDGAWWTRSCSAIPRRYLSRWLPGVWLKEKIGGMVWVSLAVGFAGVILILRPSLALLANPAALLAISAALFSAFALVSVNQLSDTEPARRILFYYFLFSSAAAAPFAILKWKDPTSREWLLLVGIGMTMALSQWLIIFAYKQASAEQIAPFNYTVVIFSGLIGWIVWA